MMSNAINLKEFHLKVNKTLDQHPYLRYGQTCFNVLYDMNPTLANEIRGGELDPFHKEEPKMGPFFIWLHKQIL